MPRSINEPKYVMVFEPCSLHMSMFILRSQQLGNIWPKSSKHVVCWATINYL